MGTYYTLHCEAKVNGKWENWDLYTFKTIGQYQIIPLIEGKSAIGGALNWYDLISEKIDRSEVAVKTLEAHPTQYPDLQDWRVFDYHAFFDGKNFAVSEYSGYMSRDVMNVYRAENEIEYLVSKAETDSFITPAEYAKLTPQAQQSYEWCEFTEPFSIHDVMRRIQQGVEIRTCLSDEIIDGPVRIVILIG